MMRLMNKTTFLVAILLLTSACSSVTIRPEGGFKDSSTPSYRQSMPFYAWGLKGAHSINVNEVCEGAAVTQMQTIMAPSDYMMSMLTLFFYSPRTVKVWCQEEV